LADSHRAALTEAEYWDAIWSGTTLPSRLDTNRYTGWRLDQWFSRYLRDQADQSILEVGCAPGASLVYFHERWGMRPVGVDYSPVGVAATRRNFELSQTPGRVIETDFFDGPQESFDVVWSAGVVEHFADLDVPMARLWQLTKPGGLLLTEVPNFGSPIYARAQRLADPSVLDRHQRIRPHDLAMACHRLGAVRIQAEFLGTWNLMVVNFSSRPGMERVARIANASLLRLMHMVRLRGPESRLLSPYVVAACRRPVGG
jgi:2-polyprenyl-6-hydroxyphenyl methylase/3-demethylubiquinone-9 3-methyltransferase